MCYGRPIEYKRRSGGLGGPIAVLAALLLGVCVGAGPARAAAQSSLRVTGPRTATVGHSVALNFKGHAASGVRRLRVWLDDRTCATTARSEGTRPGLERPTDFAVQGNFRRRLTVQRSAKGTHVVCAYLLHRGTGKTAARASWRYVTS